MKKIEILFHSDIKSIGYLIDLETLKYESGEIKDNVIENPSETGLIEDKQKFAIQIYYAIYSALKDVKGGSLSTVADR